MMMMTQNHMPHPPLIPPPPVRDSQLLAEYLERAIAQGYLRSGDGITIAHMIVGAIVNYVITSNVASKFPPPLPFPEPKQIEPAHFIDYLMATLWLGIVPES